MKKPAEKLWTVADVADFCQVKSSVVRYWVQQREIPHLKLGKFLRFDPLEVREWVEERKTEPCDSIMQGILNNLLPPS